MEKGEIMKFKLKKLTDKVPVRQRNDIKGYDQAIYQFKDYVIHGDAGNWVVQTGVHVEIENAIGTWRVQLYTNNATTLYPNWTIEEFKELKEAGKDKEAVELIRNKTFAECRDWLKNHVEQESKFI